MARNKVREELLAEVKARRRAAGQKVSRLERQGIRVRNEGLDPRRPASEVEAMTPRQLRSHLNQLNRFTSRSNGYVAGHRGVPISASMWREYQRLEKLHNANSEAYYNRIKTLQIPGLGKTVEGRLDELRKERRSGDYRSFGNFDRTVAGITDQESMKDLLNQMRKRVDPRYLEREARLQRRVINKMLRRTGNKELVPLINEMDDEDLITLSQYTGFMETLSGSYAMAKSTSMDKPRWQSSVYEDNEEKTHDLAEWAHRHFTDKPDTPEPVEKPAKTPRSEQDSDDARTPTTRKPAQPGRDRFGRFMGTESRPDPTFARDERGRFKPGRGKFNPNIK